ncbi:hypothetical protein M5J14_12985 [Lysinibacillus sp. OL1_EC]|uniref:hypothetical protein n=1 Tax=unclassified Lysinibacillus TaxID=2636778 RepID=UPI001040D4FC|nr:MULTISPECIES: hypothetical protein [unclassified Lysinibacillus]MCM0625418.1 hypothetical protein [Lysinibacillus sp. OL1_EC]MCS5500997.1 hypothetical protein [Lysinibacillus sp. A4]TBV87055.1 hypothetical protein EW028_14260 [Lysinibacillus sp. OL1]UKJ44400.1 hypothetical protein L6W14_16760 [Lysinibacillus sp. ACHW1.5]WGT41389.1 hypothetical protein QH639_11590 [Lysinibacillus sp. 1 U-2021]
MKKVVFGSALAVGLLFSGAGQSSANSLIQPIDIQGMDLESALQAVQSQRAQLFENQLKDQLEGIHQRNQQLADLNAQQGQMDVLSNSQQMDMLRLQSMNSKRNEAFDVMTNFVKKMQDSRSSIIGNMR